VGAPPDVARSHVRNPQMTHFYGAAPMALMTVGAGALLIGKDLIGTRIAVDLAWVLWTAGTLGGLFTAATIPYLMFTQLNVEPDAAFGGWLMPVVPPMVSAAAGALLIPHMAAGTGRTTMLYGCYAMFGLSLVAALIIIAMIWSRLALYGTSGTTRVPTLWIVLGPLGQGITAAGLLGANAALAVPHELADGMNIFAVLFGVPVWGFAVLWIALATQLTVRTLRRGMPFALTWWSLTFPVGTFVTGTTQLANHTGLPAFRVAAAVTYLCLLGTWALVAVQTARGSFGGNLFAPAPTAGPIKAVKDPPSSRPVLPSGRGVRRQHGAIPCIDGRRRRVTRRGTGWSGLENGRDALPTGGADRDQSAYRLARLLLLLGELLGQLCHDPATGRGERVTRRQRRAVDVQLGPVDRTECCVEAEPLLAVLLGLPCLPTCASTTDANASWIS
jgi:tellurite resistance protein TehA-like permease